MKSYKKILLAVELEPHIDEKPTRQALDLAKSCGAELHLVHVVAHLGSYGAAYGVAARADIEGMLMESAHQALREFGEKIGIPPERRLCDQGPCERVIVEQAQAIDADLIVVGCHPHKGARWLIGSTADHVLHKTCCDILAVRVED